MITRRETLGLLAGLPPLLSAGPFLFGAEKGGGRSRLGVGMYSYGIHWGAARARRKVPFRTPLEFLDHCHRLGAAGVQMTLAGGEADSPARLRARAEAHQMYIEGQVRLPGQKGDRARFEAEVAAARKAGADVVRAAVLSGRRYEKFTSARAFRQFTAQARQSLALAEPVLKKHRVRLAVENHKDWRVPELLELVKRLSSEHVGVCLDTGNSIALLEDPLAVVEAYAPYAVSTHLKDMAVAEYREGFLLAEVPLGEGFLDLKKVVATLRRAAPKVRFNLEMITRDPLKVPCLTTGYWATLEMVPGSQLARALALVRAKAPKKPLPQVSPLSLQEKLKREEANVRTSVKYARERLGL
jgi:sugar phosphate isomerase/epimerase